VPAALAVPVAVAAPVLLPLLYGPAFRAAIVPTWILLVGMAGGAVYGVLTAFLSGIGRPGLTSIAQGAGLAVTVALDLTLIPHLGIVGASIASTLSYLTTAGSRGQRAQDQETRAGTQQPGEQPVPKSPAPPTARTHLTAEAPQ
jgi:O-antigen/teichoic acid export membrane protein